jgi:hypothetical protein
MAPSAYPDASVYTVKGRETSGCRRIGYCKRKVFRREKADSQSEDQTKGVSLHINLWAKSQMKRR